SPDEAETPAAPEAQEVADPGAKELVIDETGDNEQDFDRLEAISKDWDDHFNEEHRLSRNGVDEESDKKHDAIQNMASRPQSLQEYLNEQLCLLELTPLQLNLVRYLIAHIAENSCLGRIDEDGRFHPCTLEELARDYDQPIAVDDLEESLAIVQRLDPPGVGARDLKECLLLQLTSETA